MMTYSFWRFRKKRKRITGIGLDNYVSSIIKHQYILLKMMWPYTGETSSKSTVMEAIPSQIRGKDETAIEIIEL